jgi:hypothetical protein
MLTSETLREAAKEIRAGCCQGVYEDDRGGVCANGALMRVIDGKAEWSPSSDWLRFKAATTYVHLALQGDQRDLAFWNNAPDQTQENVALAFELAAVLAEQDERASLQAVVNADLVTA